MSNPLLKMVEVLRAQYTEDQTDELSEALQMELAASIALTIPVPAVKLGNTGQAWIQHDLFVSRLLDDVNELYLLDLPKVKAAVKKIFEARYNFVHNPTGTLQATNAIVKEISEGGAQLRNLTFTTVNALTSAAEELQKKYLTEVGSGE